MNKMTVKQLCEDAGLKIITGDALDTEVSGVYACDLLSWVIGRAEENAALVSVMTNVNVVAVAAMADLSCVILTEGVRPDENALLKAQDNGIILLSTDMTTYETCAALSKYFN